MELKMTDKQDAQTAQSTSPEKTAHLGAAMSGWAMACENARKLGTIFKGKSFGQGAEASSPAPRTGRVLFPLAGLGEDVGKLYHRLTHKNQAAPDEPEQPARRAFFKQAAGQTAGMVGAAVGTVVDLAKGAMDAAEKSTISEDVDAAKPADEGQGISRRSLMRFGRK